jgi:hypothetical protein
MSSTTEKSLATLIQEMESSKDDIFLKIIRSRRGAFTHQDSSSERKPDDKLPFLTEGISRCCALFLRSSDGTRFFAHIAPRSPYGAEVILHAKAFVTSHQERRHTVEGVIFYGEGSAYDSLDKNFDGLKMVQVLLKAESELLSRRHMDVAVDSTSDLVAWRYGRQEVYQARISEIMDSTDHVADSLFGLRLELSGTVAFGQARCESALAFSPLGEGASGGGEGAPARDDHSA